MLLTELDYLFNAYQDAKYSPSRLDIHIGCDCGCGGENWTVETWDKQEAEAQVAIDNLKEFCKLYNIEWDGLE